MEYGLVLRMVEDVSKLAGRSHAEFWKNTNKKYYRPYLYTGLKDDGDVTDDTSLKTCLLYISVKDVFIEPFALIYPHFTNYFSCIVYML